MELRHLRYFVAVAAELNFSRAAKKLFVAQPALSTQIAALEREVGTVLLFRNKRVVRLTAAGAAFLGDAQSILAAVDAARDKALRVAHGEAGELAIGFFAAPTMFFLPDLIRRYRARFPKVTLRMYELTPDRQLEAFHQGKIDVGFTRPLPPGQTELRSQLLFRERLLAVFAETHPLAARRRVKLAELAAWPFVLLDRKEATGLFDHIIAACRGEDFSPSIVHSPDLMATVLTLVAAEQGVSIVPEGVQNLRRRQVVFVPLSPALDPMPLMMSWRTAAESPTLLAFRQLVDQRAAAIQREFVLAQAE